jgi:DNA invertase Pin-like site-specific DNA recombinase
VTEQEAECRNVADREGWQVVRVFVDNDRSASRYAKRERPEYRRLAEFVTSGGCDVLVTWEASRFQRDLEAYVKLRELCRAHNVLWSYSGRTYDLSRTDDRMTTGLDALLAERESDMTRDRILRSVRSNATKGRPHGKMLYGYSRTYDPTTGELLMQEIREDQAKVIREAARRFLAGETPYAIAQDFNRQEIPTPRPPRSARPRGWDLTQIRRLLTNPAYIGKRTHRGEIVGDAIWPPILDEATFHRCAARFADPNRKTHRDSSVRYLLSGLAVCGVCGGRIRVQKNRGFLAYLCIEGFHVSRKIGPVDYVVAAIIVNRLSRPDAIDLFTAPESDDEAREALQRIADIRARLETFYDAAAKGEITASALARIEAHNLAEIKVLESRARRADVPLVLTDLAGAPDVDKAWLSLSLPQQREVVATLAEVRILPTGRGRRTFDHASVVVDFSKAGA